MCQYVSNAQVKEYARAIHFMTVHCIISFQSLKECYVINNLTTNMVDSVQQNFCEKILIPSDFICLFKMSFFFWAHPVYGPPSYQFLCLLYGRPPPHKVGFFAYYMGATLIQFIFHFYALNYLWGGGIIFKFQGGWWQVPSLAHPCGRP